MEDFQPDFVASAAGLREDVAVVRTPKGQTLLLPRSLTRLDGEGQDLAATLQHTAAALAELQAALEDQVHALRDAGGSWSLVGWCVGTTGEAARQRWGEVLDDRH